MTNNSYQPSPYAQTAPGFGGYPQQTAAPDGCLDWDGEICQESGFTLLEPGFYLFTVQNITRSRYVPKGNSKIPACNLIVATLSVGGAELEENFPLHTKMEWKLSALYAAIGMKEHDQKVQMNWPATVGRSGYLEIGIRTWQRDNGGQGKSNEILRFLAPWDPDYQTAVRACAGAAQPLQAAAPQTQAEPAYIPQQQTIPGANPAPTPWTAGKF